jgi:hypothetical protein
MTSLNIVRILTSCDIESFLIIDELKNFVNPA